MITEQKNKIEQIKKTVSYVSDSDNVVQKAAPNAKSTFKTDKSRRDSAIAKLKYTLERLKEFKQTGVYKKPTDSERPLNCASPAGDGGFNVCVKIGNTTIQLNDKGDRYIRADNVDEATMFVNTFIDYVAQGAYDEALKAATSRNNTTYTPRKKYKHTNTIVKHIDKAVIPLLNHCVELCHCEPGIPPLLHLQHEKGKFTVNERVVLNRFFYGIYGDYGLASIRITPAYGAALPTINSIETIDHSNYLNALRDPMNANKTAYQILDEHNVKAHVSLLKIGADKDLDAAIQYFLQARTKLLDGAYDEFIYATHIYQHNRSKYLLKNKVC